MAEANTLVRSLHRDRFMLAALLVVVASITGLGVSLAITFRDAPEGELAVWTALMTVGVVVVSAISISRRQLRAAAQAGVLLTNGRVELAEKQYLRALRQFSIHIGAKLMALHNLAVMSHQRGDFAVAARLCEVVQRFGPSLSPSARRMSQVLMAECRLSLNDPDKALQALGNVNPLDESLPVAERLTLLPAIFRCLHANGRFAEMIKELPKLVRLAELLDPAPAAVVHELASIACRSEGRIREAQWLTARAELYHDLAPLRERRLLPPLNKNAGDAESPTTTNSDS